MSTFESHLEAATTWPNAPSAPDPRTTHAVLAHAITRSGRPLLAHHSGHQTASPTSPPITPASTVRLASCTKLLTSICALQLTERGTLTLDTPLDALLPELCAQPIVTLQPSSSSSGARLDYRPRTEPITLRRLLTHAAGTAHDALHPALAAWRASRGERTAGEERSTDVAAKYATPLAFEPGRGWAYGAGVDWAGKAVERAAGAASLEAYMREHLFGPLGMRDSTFLLAERADVEARMVETVERGKGREGLGKAEEWYPREVVDCMGGSGLVGTVADFMRVLEDLMREEPRCLRKETVERELWAPQLESEQARRELRDTMRLFAPLVGGVIPEDVRLDYGLGGLLILDDNPRTGSKANTMCWGGHGNLLWFVNREGNGVGAMFATQLMPSGDEKVSELMKEFTKEVWRRAAE